MADAGQHAVETFIAKWQGVAASAPLSLDEIVAKFDIDKVQKGGAKFDRGRLDHFGDCGIDCLGR